MKLRDRQFSSDRIGLHQTKIGHYGNWTFPWKSEFLARVASIKMSDGGQKIEFLDERTRRLFENQNDFFCAARDFRCAARTRQTCHRLFVVANHRCVDIRETINLSRAEKSDVHAPAL